MVTTTASVVERLPPHNLEAEQSLLGSLLIDRDAIIRVASFLRAEDFYTVSNGLIYQAILDLYNRREPTDFVTLSDELQRRNQFDQAGGLSYLSSLLTTVPTAVHVEYYARIVERAATLRRLIDAGTEIVDIGFRDGIETEDALDSAERAVFAVSQRRQSKDFVSMGEVLDRFFDQIDYIQQHRGEVVGVATGFSDFDQLTGGLQRSDLIIVAGRPSMGKCLTASSLIDDPDSGARMTIEQAVRGRLPRILGVSSVGKVRCTPVGDWIDSGIKPCARVTTRTGRQVEVTLHHPFLTVGGWRPLSDLTVGASIAVPRIVPVFGSVTPPAWLARLLAYYVAEGGLTGRTPEFSNGDHVIVDDFLSIVREKFPDLVIRQERVMYYAVRRDWRGKAANPITQILRNHDLWGKSASDKRLPDVVWTWDQRSLAEFLRVLISCDGTVYSMGGYPRIEFTVASENLARDVQHAFIRFGIVSKLWQKTAASWRVEVTEPESVARYLTEIGWIGAKANRVFRTDRNGSRRSNNGHPPQLLWTMVRARCAERSLSLAELGRRAGCPASNAHCQRSIPRRRLAGYAEVLEDDGMRLAASDDLYWDEIVAIEEIGEQQVYDLTVPDGANFIADDICVHNSSLALGMAYGAAVGHAKTVGIFSLEMSAEQLVQRILSMETGVDTHRLRLGQIDDNEWDRISRAFGRLSEAPIFIDDSASANIMDIRSKARRLQAEQGLDMVIVDYLQLMTARRSENRVQEVSEISRGLKGLARELNVPVVALSQLSRAVETRADHKPMLSDLRESGCLTGDTPVFLPDTGAYRPIAELCGETGFNVLAVDPASWKLVPRRVTAAFCTGRKPVFRLTTRLGRTIRATGNHQFLTFHGWRRLDAIPAGMRIALPSPVVIDNWSSAGGCRDDACIARAESPHRHAMAGFVAATRGVSSSVQRHGSGVMLSEAKHLAQGCDWSGSVEMLHCVQATRLAGATLVASQQFSRWSLDFGEPVQGIGQARAMQASPLQQLGESRRDVFWDEVSSIEMDGEEDVYDLTVDDLHNFVAADIIVHNSIEQDADIVVFIYREDKYEDDSERKGIAEIIVAKHRNGPVGSVNLRFFDRTARFADLELYPGPGM